MPSRRSTLLICLFLGAVTLAVYWPVTKNDFVNFDDDLYVTENRHVKAGLSQEGIRQVFTQPIAGFWHPLTMLSHMLDCQLFGLNPAGHHFTNVFLHIANTILLFLAFKGMTGVAWRSAFVAALFALHPLRVESVAWVSERKDVLSTFFWMLTLLAYARYAKRPGLKTYVVTLLLFVLGLMSKPMLVTLPFVFLLLDWWPLGRVGQRQITPSGADKPGPANPEFTRPGLFHLLLEKVPFMAFSGIASLLALWSQLTLNAIAPLSTLPIQVRVANALISYVRYLEKTLFPHDLAVLYPHPGMLPYWKTAGAALALFLISFAVIRSRHLHPYLLVGWLWFLGTLVPVIGLVQVGHHAMADRFTYVPLIGLFVMATWGIADALDYRRFGRTILAISGVIVLSALTASTWFQIGHWKNSITLFEHTLRVTSNNDLAHYNLGVALQQEGKIGDATVHYAEAVRIRPDYSEAHNNFGVALAMQGDLEKAISHFSEALRVWPDSAQANNNMGLAFMMQGRLDEAVVSFARVLEKRADYVEAHQNMAIALFRQGRFDEAIAHFSKTLEIKPNLAVAHNGLGVALARQGRIEEAIFHFREALRIEPGHQEAIRNLELALELGRR
jgi:Flp pilus assembly protein TadD